MATNWPVKVLRQCKGKVRFPSQGKADAAARSLERDDERNGRDLGPVRGYFCVRCRSYHIGHARERAA